MIMKFKAFTLLEILIAIVLFSFCMLIIVSLITTNLRLIDKLYNSDKTRSNTILLTKALDNIVRDSYNIIERDKNDCILHSFNGSRYEIAVSNSFFFIKEFKKDVLWNERSFSLDNTAAVNIKPVKSLGKNALRLRIEAKGIDIDKIMLAGYQKNEGS